MSKGRSNVSPVRGDVWSADLDPIVGHEQGGFRPILVVSADLFNRSPAGLIMVTPITTADRKLIVHIPVHPPEGGLTRPSFIMTDQVRAISKLRLGRRIGTISPATMTEVEDRLHYLLGL
jgi:mRNA interferase MazF